MSNEIIDKDLLESAKSGKLRKGRKWLIKHLEGVRLTRNQAISAKCYDCNGMGESYKCEIRECSLYPFSPYKTHCTAVSVKTDSQIPEIGS